ncbi:hypothetical protein OBBRIDRAFT_737661 [Obba rivulosa]|uniref:DUF6533 domain-containing protein n=1 Tax=Obba rivulosa TaxID=1052685 RepID=A0A8E2DI98_9APHY|nr:hypothetical protein OBBRIDRAFT_737661 [Obba rivulosa]
MHHNFSGILYYEYLATISLEVKVYWKKGTISFTAVLYALNRYLTLMGGVPIIFEFFGDMSESVIFHQYFIAVTQAVIAGMLTLRTVALYEGSKLILVLLISMICTGVGIAAVSMSVGDLLLLAYYIHPSSTMPAICHCPLASKSQNVRLVAPFGVILVFDTIVFVLTIARGIRFRCLWDASVFRILLRDGAAYYGVMVVMNVVNILTSLVRSARQRGMVTTLTNVISSILMTRLMLNLRDLKRSAMPGMTSAYGYTSSDIELTESSLFSHSAGETVSTYPSIYDSGEQAG